MDGKREMRRRRGITPELQQAAWRLRSEMTPAEEVLWEALRDRRLNGLRFRRQHPVGQFVLDFYCSLWRCCINTDAPFFPAAKATGWADGTPSGLKKERRTAEF